MKNRLLLIAAALVVALGITVLAATTGGGTVRGQGQVGLAYYDSEPSTATPTPTDTPTPSLPLTFLNNTATPTPTPLATPTPTDTPTPSLPLTYINTATPTPSPTPQVSPTSECLVPVDLDLIIVIDKTGSMGPNSDCTGTPCRTRIEWAKQAALALVDGIAGGSSSHSLGNNHVEVITFDGATTAQLVSPPLGNSDADLVRSAINGINNPEGDTYIAKGIEAATSDLNAHVHVGSGHGSYKVVVLLSDGRNYVNGDHQYGTYCPATHQRRADTVDAIDPLHDAADTVYTIGLGSETGGADDCNPYELDTALLTQISEGPPGDYTQVIDASTLPDIYSEISHEVKNICVSFSGHKYDDAQCDGLPEPNSGLAGVDIVLLKEDGPGDWTENDRVASGGDGSFAFVAKPTGHYLVCEDITELPWTERLQTDPLGPGTGLLEYSDYGWCYDVTLAEPGDSAEGLDFYNCLPTPTPTPTSTYTPTPTNTATPTPTNTATPTPTNTATPTPTNTATPTPTDTATPTPTDTATPTPTDTATPTPTDTATPTPTDTATPTPTDTATPTPTDTATPTPTEGPSDGHKNPTPTFTPTRVPPTATPTPVSIVGPIVVTPPPRQAAPEAMIMPPTGTGTGSGDGLSWATIAGSLMSLLGALALFGGLRMSRIRERSGTKER
jgi:hypothetical protein